MATQAAAARLAPLPCFLTSGYRACLNRKISLEPWSPVFEFFEINILKFF
jgi:hypothetical protein